MPQHKRVKVSRDYGKSVKLFYDTPCTIKGNKNNYSGIQTIKMRRKLSNGSFSG
jgi:hypothetical protein